MTATNILPTYQRFVNGVPVPFSRRSFRPREKYVIFLVFFTFGLVCFGTFFFLPEFRGSNSAADSVYKVYDQIKRAGPELLIPPPPHLDVKDSLKVKRHDDDNQVNSHVIGDREKLKAKIEQDGSLKVLERPDIAPNPKSSSTAKVESNQLDENVGREIEGVVVPQDSSIVTVPPALSDHYPDINRGEDRDRTAREKRNKIKEVRRRFIAHFFVLLSNLDSEDLLFSAGKFLREAVVGVVPEYSMISNHLYFVVVYVF